MRPDQPLHPVSRRAPMSTFETSRDIPASAAEVFAAFEAPTRLANWWGPKGFRNTFNVCKIGWRRRSARAAAAMPTDSMRLVFTNVFVEQ